MVEAIRETLVSTVLNIFETMFFTFLEPLEGTSDEDSFPSKDSEAARWLTADIRFNGGQSGSLSIYLPWELGEVMAQNFLGFEEDRVMEEQVNDMARELANMVCGNLFSTLDKMGIVFLDTPKSRMIGDLEKKGEISPGDMVAEFASEDKVVTVVLRRDTVPTP
jgi:CheY-specific phosphatase CheX